MKVPPNKTEQITRLLRGEGEGEGEGETKENTTNENVLNYEIKVRRKKGLTERKLLFYVIIDPTRHFLEVRTVSRHSHSNDAGNVEHVKNERYLTKDN